MLLSSVIMAVLGITFLLIGVDGNMLWTFIGVILLPIGALGTYSSFAKDVEVNNTEAIDPVKQKEEQFQNWISEKLSEYNVSFDDLKYLYTTNKYYIINPDTMKFIFIDFSSNYNHVIPKVSDFFDLKVIDLFNVRQVSLKQSNETKGEIVKDNAIGRALVGGALFGTAGAIVGSSSAKEKQVQSNKRISTVLEIITKDVANPYSTILLYEEKDEMKTDFVKMEHSVNNLYWSLENCLEQNKLRDEVI